MATEKFVIKSVNSRNNLYHVPAKQWAKWSEMGRQVFNEVYNAMSRQQWLFLHPKQEKMSRSHWKTTAWNAAWLAADATR